MSEEKKEEVVLEKKPSENLDSNQGESEEVTRLKKEAEDAKEDARIAREDAANYQSEADIAKSKLDDKDQLNVREESVAEREHKVCISEMQRDYPDVCSRFPGVFDSLKGEEKEAYLTQAKYLQQGLDGGEKPEEKPAENASDNNQPNNNDGAKQLPDSGQNNQAKHIFTRAELTEHTGDLEWFNANEAEINRQTGEGLIV